MAAVFGFVLLASSLWADQNWDGDNPIGNFSYNNNWFGDTQPAFGFGNGSLYFSYRNNGSQTSLYYDYSSWVDTNNIYFASTFGTSAPLNGNGNGINFAQRIENDSNFAQTINIPTSGGKNSASQIELNPVNGDLTLNGAIYNDNFKSYHVYGNNGKTLTVNTTLTANSAVSFTDENNNVVVFGAAQNYGGATSILGGSINASVANALGGTSGITVNSSGTLILSGSSSVTDRINNSATLSLAGGRFNTGGLSEHGVSNNTAGIGAVTLSATSILDLGSGASVIAFANSNGATWISGAKLNIYNWTGNPSGGGLDQVFFGTSATGLTGTQLAQIEFFSGAGIGDLGAAMILSTGEIVPVPEPSTWAAGILAVVGLGWSQRRRLPGS